MVLLILPFLAVYLRGLCSYWSSDWVAVKLKFRESLWGGDLFMLAQSEVRDVRTDEQRSAVFIWTRSRDTARGAAASQCRMPIVGVTIAALLWSVYVFIA